MIRTLLVLLLAFVSLGSAQAEGDRLFYSKFFKGSTPEYQEIILSPDGACKYKEATDDPNPIEFTLPEAMRTEMFQLAAELGYFAKPLESNLAIAKMGEKTFRFEGSHTGSQTFNYSLEPAAQKLQTLFERIAESQQLYIRLEYSVKFDRLGINDALVAIENSRTRERLVPTEHFLPLLERVVKNKRFMNIARNRADVLARYVRESNGIAAQ